MTKITDSVVYTGVLNPNLRVFDIIMKTEFGTSYNSYVVKGADKVALIESSHLHFEDYYLDNIRKIYDNAPDYLILNHCEPDHTGCVAKLVELYPSMTIVVSAAGSIYIKNIVKRSGLNIKVVKDGDCIDLGGKKLYFFSAPFLHWPDSMFTYLAEDKVLFTCDFLGSHYCEPQTFDYRIKYNKDYMSALKYYYDCIFGPFPQHVRKGLQIIKTLEVDFACTSHGPVLCKSGRLSEVLSLYDYWSEPKKNKEMSIPVFYCSAYGNTAKIAAKIADGIKTVIPAAKIELYNIIEHDIKELSGLLNESDAFLVGSPTINRDAVAPVWQLLAGIEAINIVKRPVALFGSYGWSGEALPHIAERLSSLKAALYPDMFKLNFVPSGAELDAAYDFGIKFAKTLV